MKKDLKDLIINTRRHDDDAWASYRINARKNKDYDSEYWNTQKETMARYAKSISDRLAPLIRYLESNCGKPWYKVWHDICEDNDNRSVRGHHLREHALQMVDNNGISKESIRRWRRSWGFYVDDSGILRKHEDKGNRKKIHPKNNFITEKDKNIYVLSNLGWYRTPNLCRFNHYTAFSGIILDYSDKLGCFAKDCAGDDSYLPRVPKYLIQRDPSRGFEFISYRDLCKLYSTNKLSGCIIVSKYQQASWKEIEIALGQKKSK